MSEKGFKGTLIHDVYILIFLELCLIKAFVNGGMIMLLVIDLAHCTEALKAVVLTIVAVVCPS